MSEDSQTKSAQRRSALARRRSLLPQERAKLSARIQARLCSSELFRRAKRIACYQPMADEVQMQALQLRTWSANKRVFLPRITRFGKLQFRQMRPNEPLRRNSIGILEPVKGAACPLTKLDLVIVPLVGFDANGNRIGMGGGYYDRTFAGMTARQRFALPRLVGVAFACQEVEQIAASPWDIPLFRVFTENDCVTATHARR